MSSAPAIPARAPESAMPSQMQREEGMPLARAASRPAPTARHSKPRTVRVRRNQTAAATASARGKSEIEPPPGEQPGRLDGSPDRLRPGVLDKGSQTGRARRTCDKPSVDEVDADPVQRD